MSKPPKKSRAVIQRKNSAKPAKRGKPFGAGNEHAFKPGDSRINRNGRPKSHDELRALIQVLAAEPDERNKNLTRVEVMLLKMFKASSAADRVSLIEHGWGKVMQEHTLTWRDEAAKRGIDPDAVIAAARAALADSTNN